MDTWVSLSFCWNYSTSFHVHDGNFVRTKGKLYLINIILVGNHFIYFDTKHDELLLSVNDVDWYLLSINDQKQLMILIQASQRYHDLQYVFGKLDLQTFVEVIKTILLKLNLI